MDKQTDLGPVHCPQCLRSARDWIGPVQGDAERVVKPRRPPRPPPDVVVWGPSRPTYSLVNGLEELPLVFPDFGMVGLL